MQHIRVLIQSLAGHIPTVLIVFDPSDSLAICDKLNCRLALDRAA